MSSYSNQSQRIGCRFSSHTFDCVFLQIFYFGLPPFSRWHLHYGSQHFVNCVAVVAAIVACFLTFPTRFSNFFICQTYSMTYLDNRKNYNFVHWNHHTLNYTGFCCCLSELKYNFFPVVVRSFGVESMYKDGGYQVLVKFTLLFHYTTLNCTWTIDLQLLLYSLHAILILNSGFFTSFKQ